MYKKVVKAAKCIDSYLNCNDFNSKVILTHEDGSKFSWNYAFYIKLLDYILVFTEHHDYYVFDKEEVISVSQRSFK